MLTIYVLMCLKAYSSNPHILEPLLFYNSVGKRAKCDGGQYIGAGVG